MKRNRYFLLLGLLAFCINAASRQYGPTAFGKGHDEILRTIPLQIKNVVVTEDSPTRIVATFKWITQKHQPLRDKVAYIFNDSDELCEVVTVTYRSTLASAVAMRNEVKESLERAAGHGGREIVDLYGFSITFIGIKHALSVTCIEKGIYAVSVIEVPDR